MNIVNWFGIVVGVAFLVLWLYGGRLLVWLESLERSLDDSVTASSSAGDVTEVHEVVGVSPSGHTLCACGDFDCQLVDQADDEEPFGDQRTVDDIRHRLDVEMRRRGHRGRR